MMILAYLAQIEATKKMGAWTTLFQYGVCTYVKDKSLILNRVLERQFGGVKSQLLMAVAVCEAGTLTQESLLPYKPAPVPSTASQIVTPELLPLDREIDSCPWQLTGGTGFLPWFP